MEKVKTDGINIALIIAGIALVLSVGSLYYGYNIMQSLGAINEKIDIIYQTTPSMIIEAAQEGEVMWYAAFTPTTAEEIIAAFEAKYPFIDVTWTAGPGGTWALLEKYESEAAAGLFIADVMMLPYAPTLKIDSDGWLDRYDSPEMVNFPEVFVDPEHHYTTIGVQVAFVAVHTELLSNDELWPKDWTDFINPREEWEGITFNDARLSATGYGQIAALYQYYGEETCKNIWLGLASIGLQNLGPGSALLPESMLRGESKITITLMNFRYGPYVVEQGAPFEIIYMESGTHANQDNCIGVFKEAPHPNAARLFNDFLLGEEVANIFAKYYRYPTRIGAPGPKGMVALGDIKLMPLDEREAAEYREELMEDWLQWIGAE